MKKFIYLTVSIAAIVIMVSLSGCPTAPTSGKKGGVHPPANPDSTKNSDTAKADSTRAMAPAVKKDTAAKN
jgi:hypothetical protein